MKSFLPMRRAALVAFGGSAALLLGLSTPALAQSDPAFTYGKVEDAPEVKKAVWKASAQAGLLLATGNSNSLTVSGGGSVSRVDARNKLALDVEARFGQTTTLGPRAGLTPLADGNVPIASYDDIVSNTAISTQYWGVKLRYDRFFSKNNLGYIVGQAMGDDPAGKHVFGGGQIGYSRQLYKSERNELLAELGYDFTFVVFTKADTSAVYIHSLRAFLGYNLTLSKDTAINTGIEGLFNLNTYASPGFPDPITPFQDARVNFKTALNTRLHKNVSFRFSFKVRFDNVPAPRAAIPGADFVGGFTPLAETVDTLSEAALIVNFL